ncbi:hypothetical protein LJC13_01750 [Peptostreptococcaceae bacterium OttesenSCG-928-C18]|nr:hypothetical protein [Peptostreptococcaceae bacterium OttesenSCG-928-C18]
MCNLKNKFNRSLNYILKAIIENNQSKLNLSSKQKERWHKKCLCLVGFKDVEIIDFLDFDHQGNMDDWLII